MNDTETIKESKLPKPAKDIFEEFIYKECSLDYFPILPSNQKNVLDFSLNSDVISVVRYMFYQMYRNRIKPEYNRQEVATLSYPNIAKFSRVPIAIVKRVVPYAIDIGLIHLMEGGGKTRRKGTYCPGVKIHEFYPQN